MTQPLDLERMREALEILVVHTAMEDAQLATNCERILAGALDALSSERAAREEAEGERDAALREMSKYARQAGEAIGKLETSELAGIVEGWKDRALAAEAQVSALQAQVDGLREALERASDAMRMTALVMESPIGRVTKKHVIHWTSLFHQESEAIRALLSQPPADEPAKGEE